MNTLKIIPGLCILILLTASAINALMSKDKVFVTEAEGGNQLVKIDRNFFDPQSPGPNIQFIVVSLRWNEKDSAKSEVIREFKQNFYFKALQQMLGK